jgi:hypothetical protein
MWPMNRDKNTMIEAPLSDYGSGGVSISTRFRPLGFNADFTESTDKNAWFCLDGMIQLDGGRLQNATGSAQQTIVEALSRQYNAKGEAFLQDLSGSFRLAVWDSKKQKLVVAVDPFATRPLYY